MKKCLIISLFWIIVMTVSPRQTTGESLTPQVMYSRYDSRETLFIDRDELQRIFTRQTVQWKNGQEIVVYTKPLNSPEHKIFVSETLNMTLYRFLRDLAASPYMNGGKTVHEVPNDQAMIREVLSHNGAIGYVNYELVAHDKHIIVVGAGDK
jgi:ABC-type phosphate transport system substrate-binding protein